MSPVFSGPREWDPSVPDSDEEIAQAARNKVEERVKALRCPLCSARFGGVDCTHDEYDVIVALLDLLAAQRDGTR